MYTPDYSNSLKQVRVRGEIQLQCHINGKSKKHQNAVWEPSDEKVNGWQNFEVLQPQPPYLQ